MDYKLVCIDMDGTLLNKQHTVSEAAKEALRKAHHMGVHEFEIASSSKHNIEVTCKGVSKGRAVEILAAYYNIDRDEIIAMGDSDSENDLSMIEFAGMGIAMGNAIDIVKQKADYVTDTNDNDGVAKIINKFVKANLV